jgi:hypothetical protein
MMTHFANILASPLLWLDPGLQVYHDQYGFLQWEPPSWILQCFMVRVTR